jgi:hypothetical protein
MVIDQIDLSSFSEVVVGMCRLLLDCCVHQQ